MIVAVVRIPSRCAVSMTSSHCAVLILSGQMIARTSSSRISAAVPGNEPRPASLQLRRETTDIEMPSVAAPCADFQRREGVDVHLGHTSLIGAANREISRAVVVGMDAALQAHFHRAAIPGLDDATLRFPRASRS